jgi:S1-C subfamily serine protease
MLARRSGGSCHKSETDTRVIDVETTVARTMRSEYSSGAKSHDLGSRTTSDVADAKDDVIIAIDGQTHAMTESDFLVSLRLNHGPKDSVKFTLLRGTERHEVTVPMW